MTANLEKFTRGLEQLLDSRHVTSVDPALQAATVLLSLDLDSESRPSADLRTRWISRTRPARPIVRNSLMTSLRTRPLVAILIAALVLLVLSGVAYALGQVFGYIPGIGLVDQSTPIRVLAEPVSQMRDGIMVTVSEVVLTSSKTVIRMRFILRISMALTAGYSRNWEAGSSPRRSGRRMATG